MCIGVWTLNHPDYALILGTNRDESLHRPTQDAHFHSFQNDRDRLNSSSIPGNILSGRDGEAGGSWFGLNRAGRVALLTNITESPKSFNSSRGQLVSSFLLSDSSHPLDDEVGRIIPPDAKFAGFNLLLLAPTPPSTSTIPIETGTSEERGQELETRTEEATLNPREQKLYYDAMLVTNHGAGGRLEARRLSSAEQICGCISNGIDGQGGSEWPKVKKLSHSFEEALESLTMNCPPYVKENELVKKLFDILTWQSPEPVTERSQLRNTVQVTPFSLPIKPDMSSNLDSGPAINATEPSSHVGILSSPALPVTSNLKQYYGTRLSTVLLVRRDGSVLFIERDIWRLDENGVPQRLEFHESRGEDNVKERVFEFNLDCKYSSESQKERDIYN